MNVLDSDSEEDGFKPAPKAPVKKAAVMDSDSDE